MSSEEITMKDVVAQLGLDCDMSKGQVYIACPMCAKNERQKKLNINFSKNVFRCNKCDVHGGPIAFWGMYRGLTDPKEIAKDYFKAAGKTEKVKTPAAKADAPASSYEEEVVASLEKRNAAYKALINETALSDSHLAALKKRGLSEETIIKNEYRSVQMFDLKKLAQKVQKEHGVVLDNVPGFYTEDGTWTLRKFQSGIMIPQRNGRGEIQGFQIRFDNPKGDCPRYISLSSRDMENGAPAHSYCHLARGKKGCKTVILTEGALKADVISDLTGYTVIAVPGVNSRKYLPDALKSLKWYGLEKVLIAFDMDKTTNVHVLNALERLKKEISSLGLEYCVLNWDEKYKGLDDYLYAKREALL